MPLVPFATRLSESKRSYIRYKAMHTGKDIQDLVDEMIDFYQRHDSEFMKLFATLSLSNDSTKEVGNNDQESLNEK
ncbi:hypothetical protein GCM10016272_01500 [Psychrobacter glaciei]|uniref:Uncharacterized protein n=1 Tax=Psychrobacter glaciei TaxID=619771 RepID=A0ABQ3GLP0_9GAMM|nr:hypothetical protein [Psychrobacter glaciei]GHD25554.1 hypothetical protein GCM10016272_01500 [Psychrobacter glaciei]